jgi:hypothetical protein
MKLSMKLANKEEFVMTAGIAGVQKDGKIPVRTATGFVLAVRAAGCLLEPGEGDLVLLVQDYFGGGYILTVLERDPDKPAIVDTPGNMILKAGGSIDIAGEDVNLSGTEQLDLVAPILNLRTRDGRIESENLSITGKHLSADLISVKTVLGSLESSIGRLVERIGRYYARVEELADMKYKKLRCIVQDSMLMKGRDVTVRAEKNINMDGKKINVG